MDKYLQKVKSNITTEQQESAYKEYTELGGVYDLSQMFGTEPMPFNFFYGQWCRENRYHDDRTSSQEFMPIGKNYWQCKIATPKS